MTTDFRRVAIIGLGFMGGSFGKALQSAEPGLQIATYDPNGAVLEGMSPCQDTKEAVEAADLIVLATPLSVYETVLTEIAPHMRPGALLMDLGSVKSGLEALFNRCLSQHPQCLWVGGHPMCGSDKSGAAYADGQLFEGAKFFLTGHLAPPMKSTLEKLIRSIGAQPVWVTETEHDAQVAVTSHLPHLNAAALMHCTAERPEATAYMAGGFRDATRVAGGSEVIWKDILIWNKAAVLSAIAHYSAQLETIAQLLEKEDSEGLERYLKTARNLKIDQNSTS